MKFNRTKNASRNILYGLLSKAYTIIVPFLMRTLMIYLLGTQYLGLNSLFSSVLSVLNLAELGVGSAIFYSMYKPIAEDDTETICALMALYKKYYRIIGALILVVGGALTPWIPSIIKAGTLPEDVNIYILYWMNLGATVLSYWLFAYKNCLLGAHQRGDIGSKISMISTTFTYILQILILVFLRNYYLYTFVVIGVGIVNNIITACIVDHMYPQYKPRGKLDKSVTKTINRRVRDLFTSKIGTVVYDSADTIVISTFLGLNILAIYQNYYYILNSIVGFVGVIYSACTAGIGNSLVTETKAKNFNDLKKLTLIICWISTICSCCLLCLYQPFMEIWVGRKLMLDYPAVICLVLYFFVREINQLLTLYKDASGMWHEDRLRPLAAALANLIMNLILVQYIGIYGILLSTVFAIAFVGEPWLLHNLFTVVFERKKLRIYLKKLCGYLAVAFFCCIVCNWGCGLFKCNPVTTLIINGVICVIVPNIILFVVYHNTDDFHACVKLLNKISHGKLDKWEKKGDGQAG